jgi:hypothetical protein
VRVSFVVAAAVAACPASAEPLIEIASALSRRHDVRVVLDRALDPRQDVAVEVDGAPLERALDAIAVAGRLRWSRDTAGAVVFSSASPRASVSLDPLRIVAPSIEAAERLAQADDAPGSSRGNTHWLAHEPAAGHLPLGRRFPNASGQGAGLSLRGVARTDVSSTASAIELDGILVSPLLVEAEVLDAFDLSEVRYERGPVTSRAGPLAMAGLVRLSSGLPQGEGGRVQLEHDDRGSRRQAVVQDFAFGDVETHWSARLRDEQPSFDWRTPAGREAPRRSISAFGGRARGRFGETAVEGVAHRFASDGPPAQAYASPSGAAPMERRSYRDHVPDATTEGTLAGLTVVHDAAPGQRVWFRASGSDASNDEHERLLDDATRDVRARDRLSRVEAWWSSDFGADRWRFVAGVDAERQTQRRDQAEATPLRSYFPGGVFVTPGVRREIASANGSTATTRSALLELSRRGRVTVSVSVRGIDRRERTGTTSSLRLSDDACVIRFGRLEEACLTQFPEQSVTRESETRHRHWLPSASVSGAIGASWHASLNARTGYRGGGRQYDRVLGRETRYGAERSRSLDGELRFASPDGRTEARLGVFVQRWDDLQVRTPIPELGTVDVTNAGRAHAHGAELEASTALGSRWRMHAGVGVIRTRYDGLALQALGGTGSADGNRFPDAPSHTAALGLLYTAPSGAYLALMGWQQAGAYSDPANTPAGRRVGFRALDLRFGHRTERSEFSCGVTNASDEEWLDGITLRGLSRRPYTFRPGPERAVTIGYSWSW